MFGCTNIIWNVFYLFFLHVKSIVYEVYPPYCVCNPWAHVSHLVFRLHCHVRLSVFGSAAFELIYLFPWFPPSLPCALSYFQDLKVIHPNQGGLCHQFACTRFSCLFSAVCVISLSVGCVFTWIVPSDAARSPTSSFLLRPPRSLRQGYGCFPQTLPDSARQSHKDTSTQGNMLLRLKRVCRAPALNPETATPFWGCSLSSSCESTTVCLCQSLSVEPVDLPPFLSVFQPVCPFSCKIMTHT